MKSKGIVFVTLIASFLLISTTVYIDEYNNVEYRSFGLNIDTMSFKNLSYVKMNTVNEVLTVSSFNNNSGSWIVINSRLINVNPGSKLLLELDAKYQNTDQTSVRVLGISNNSVQFILAYALIAAGNSSWKYYSSLTKVPSSVFHVIIQISIGWTIFDRNPETFSVKGISLYTI